MLKHKMSTQRIIIVSEPSSEDARLKMQDDVTKSNRIRINPGSPLSDSRVHVLQRLHHHSLGRLESHNRGKIHKC